MSKRLIWIASVAILSFVAWSCKAFKGAAISAKPDPIEVHADSIQYQVRASIPPKAGIKKGGVYSAEVMIGNRTQIKAAISADRYPDIKKTGMDTTAKIKTAFYDDMDGNSVMIKQSYERRGKQFELPPIENLAQCCITTSRLVMDPPQLLFSKNDYVKEVPITLEAKFNFPKNVFEIQKDEFVKEDIKGIGDFLGKKWPATKITIVGFASPEGPYKRNVMLSVNRSKEVQKWLTEQLKTAGYAQYLDSTFFDITVTHEDWDGFKSSVNGLPYPQDIKTQILEIISAGKDEDTREKQIMALVGGKEKVESILAPLRRGTILVQGFEPRRSDAEMDKITGDFISGKFTGNLKETFEKEEWLYATDRVADKPGKKVLLEAFRVAYPSDVRGLSDLGALTLIEGDAKKGLDLLEGAAKVSATDANVQNNLGVAYAKNKKYKEARQAFEASLATKSSAEANFNLGVVLERAAMYNKAVEKFNSSASVNEASYNAGLCKLLNNDLAGAKASLTEFIKANKENQWGYYLLAVTGARASDANIMTVNLRKACELDGTLKGKAKKDLEFRKFFTSAEFKAATN